MKNLRKEKDTTFVVSFSWRGAVRLGRTATAFCDRAEKGERVERILSPIDHSSVETVRYCGSSASIFL